MSDVTLTVKRGQLLYSKIFFKSFWFAFQLIQQKFYLPVLSCSPVQAVLRRKNIYFLSGNGSSKPSPRISHFQLELDKLPYVITRLKPICHRWNAVSQLGKCLACCTASQRCLKASQSFNYSNLRPTHTLTDIPGLPQLYLEPFALPFSALFCHSSKLDQHFSTFYSAFFPHTLTPFPLTPKSLEVGLPRAKLLTLTESHRSIPQNLF